jgi:nucleotide-binding universal stress UspA family protein
MKSLLLNINPDPGHEARLATAIALAKGWGSNISCIQVLPLPSVAADATDMVAMPTLMETMERTARAFQAEVEARLERAGVGWSWLRLFGDAATMIVSQSRLADVILLSAEEPYPPVSAVAPNARPPVLAVPQKNPDFTIGVPALLAWNGSPAAANAMRAALPLLLRTTEPVQIVSVDGDGEEFPAARAVDYLSYHGLRAEVHWRNSDGRTVAETILALARQLETGLVVAGAFGHNRIREMLLGSVTRALLKSSPLPLLLAH